MQTTAAPTTLVHKVKELCEAILEDTGYQKLMEQVDAFLDDEPSREQYRETTEFGQELQQKQRMGQELEAVEVMTFEKQRDALFENPLISDFISAQRELGELQGMLTAYVEKTIELGRLPEEDELSDAHGGGCCGGGGGGGCGCH
jgi:cell fate (sporulation/competence/biofilm development) regulator YlbF (YheA/YmcA/DUF963 family)